MNSDRNQHYGRNFGRDIVMGLFSSKKPKEKLDKQEKKPKEKLDKQEKKPKDKQELRYLSRKDVLELLREQTRRSIALEKEVKELKEQLKERDTAVQNAGLIVEEALSISEVFEKAISDSRRHVTNIQRMNIEQYAINELEENEDKEETDQAAD